MTCTFGVERLALLIRSCQSVYYDYCRFGLILQEDLKTIAQRQVLVLGLFFGPPHSAPGISHRNAKVLWRGHPDYSFTSRKPSWTKAFMRERQVGNALSVSEMKVGVGRNNTHAFARCKDVSFTVWPSGYLYASILYAGMLPIYPSYSLG